MAVGRRTKSNRTLRKPRASGWKLMSRRRRRGLREKHKIIKIMNNYTNHKNHSLENQFPADNKHRWAKVYPTESKTHDHHHPPPGTDPQITQRQQHGPPVRRLEPVKDVDPIDPLALTVFPNFEKCQPKKPQCKSSQCNHNLANRKLATSSG